MQINIYSTTRHKSQVDYNTSAARIFAPYTQIHYSHTYRYILKIQEAQPFYA